MPSFVVADELTVCADFLNCKFSVNDNGSSQRYAYPNDTYSSLFGDSLDLKSDLTCLLQQQQQQQHQQQHHQPQSISFSDLDPNSLPTTLPTTVLGLNMMSCLNPSTNPPTHPPTHPPTIYTIKDHDVVGAGHPLINLANPDHHLPPGGVATDKDPLTPCTALQQKKRKLSITDSLLPVNGPSASKSPNVKQEPRKIV